MDISAMIFLVDGNCTVCTVQFYHYDSAVLTSFIMELSWGKSCPAIIWIQ